MGGLKYSVGLCVLVLVVIFNTHAAPRNYPTRTFEGDTNVNSNDINASRKANSDSETKKPEVRTDERYHKVYEDGTVEFKTALSNGHIQYQRISNKVVDGKKMQVYVGYVSVPYADGRYGTTYYVADENGFRQTPVEIANTPPVLPKRGPISNDFYNSNDRGHELDYEKSTFEKNNNEGVKNVHTGLETESNEVLPKVEESVANVGIEENVAIVQELPNTEENLLIPSVLPHTEGKTDGIVPALEESIGRTSSVLIDSEASTHDPQLAEGNHDNSSVLPITEETKKAEENEIDYEQKSEGAPEDFNNLSVQPITEQNQNEENVDSSSVLSITEDSKTIDSDLTSTLDGTNNSQQDSSENEVSGSLPVTEESEKSTEVPVFTTVQDTNELKGDDNKDTTEPSVYSVTESIFVNDIEDSDDSTVVTVLPTLQDEAIEEDVDSTSLPITEESVTKIQETDVYAETTVSKVEGDNGVDGSGELPTTEENIVTETFSQNELNNEDTSEGFTEVPVEEKKVHEASTELPIAVTEEKILEVSTEVPELSVTEQISTETDKTELIQGETSTELSSSHDVLLNKDGDEATTDQPHESSTESDKTELIQDETSTELPSNHEILSDEEKNHEVSTKIQESSATDAISTTSSNDEVNPDDATTENEQSSEDSYSSASAEAHTEQLPAIDAITTIEDTHLEDVTSTELPSTHEILSEEENNHEVSTEIQESSATDAISTTSSNDQVNPNDATTENQQSSQDLASSVSAEAHTEQLPAIDATTTIEDTHLEVSTDGSSEDVIKNENSTELPSLTVDSSDEEKLLEVSTSVPALQVTEDISSKIEEAKVVEIEGSTELPSSVDILAEQEMNHETSTEIPAVQISEETSSVDNEIINEATTGLSTLESTEVPAPTVPTDVQVEELPGLDVLVEYDSLKHPALTKTEEEIEAQNDKDALNVSSTELPDKIHQEENSAYDASTAIPALPVTDEISIKSDGDNVIQTEVSSELPASNSEETIKNDVEESDTSERSFLANLLHSMKFF